MSEVLARHVALLRKATKRQKDAVRSALSTDDGGASTNHETMATADLSASDANCEIQG